MSCHDRKGRRGKTFRFRGVDRDKGGREGRTDGRRKWQRKRENEDGDEDGKEKGKVVAFVGSSQADGLKLTMHAT